MRGKYDSASSIPLWGVEVASGYWPGPCVKWLGSLNYTQERLWPADGRQVSVPGLQEVPESGGQMPEQAASGCQGQQNIPASSRSWSWANDRKASDSQWGINQSERELDAAQHWPIGGHLHLIGC